MPNFLLVKPDFQRHYAQPENCILWEMGMAIKLYDLCGADRALRFSPACWRTRMALAHKGLEVETVPTLFTDIPSIGIGGHKTVPVITDGAQEIRDSFAIAHYLEAIHADRPSLFGGRGGESLSRFMHHWADSFVDARIARLCIHDIYLKLDPADQPYFRETREARFGMSLEEAQDQSAEAVARFRRVLSPVRQMLEDQDFFGGRGPLYADYCLFGSLQWARMVSDLELLQADDPIAEWFERCLDLFDGLGRASKV